jgi:hypothetical protein
MESLALAAAIIMLAIIFFGIVAVAIVVRPPRRKWTRVLATVAVAPAVLAGLWLALLEVGLGARLMGVAVLCAGGAALRRTWRRL